MRAHTLTPERKRALAPQLAEQRLARPARESEFALRARVLGSLGLGDVSGFRGFGGGISAGPSPYGRARTLRQLPPRGISPERWTGPDWYWIWRTGRHQSAMHELLQLCYVEADGELTGFDDIDEVGAEVGE